MRLEIPRPRGILMDRGGGLARGCGGGGGYDDDARLWFRNGRAGEM